MPTVRLTRFKSATVRVDTPRMNCIGAGGVFVPAASPKPAPPGAASGAPRGCVRARIARLPHSAGPRVMR
eukprot:1038804-Prymnesium_polylepis.1